MTSQVKINGKNYPVNFGFYALHEYAFSLGLKTVRELFELFEAGDFTKIIDLYYHGLKSGALAEGKELDIDLIRFRYLVDDDLMLQFNTAFNNQYQTVIPENPTKPMKKSGKN